MPRGVARIPEPREWLLTKRCNGPCGETKPWAKFSPAKYWPDGSVRCVQSKCQACAAVDTAARYPGYRERNRESLRTYNREWARQRRAGLRRERRSTANLVESQPLRDFLRRLMAESGGEESLGTLSQTCGLTDGILRRVMREPRLTMRLADDICTHLGAHLNDLYPELAEVAA